MPLLPQNDPQKSSYVNDQSAIWREIKALWQKTKLVTASQTSKELIFSYSGAPTVNIVSPPYLIQQESTYTYATVVAGTVGSTDSVVTLYQNGTSVATLTLLATQTIGNYVVTIDTNEGDAISVAITTVGTGVKDITIQVSN